MSSFTKTVAPGLRIGYAIAPTDLATQAHSLRHRYLHRARRARAVDARRLPRGGQLRAERRTRRRRARTSRGQHGCRRCASTSRPGRTSSSRMAATSCGSISAATGRIRPSCSPRRPRPASRTSRAPTSTRPPVGNARCGSHSRRCRPPRSARASRGSPRSSRARQRSRKHTPRILERDGLGAAGAAPGGRHGPPAQVPATHPTSLWGERVGRIGPRHEPMGI